MDIKRRIATEFVGRIYDLKLKIKRPFALKVSDMNVCIPDGALKIEVEELTKKYIAAFVQQKLQETAILYSDFFGDAYKQIKSENPPNQFQIPDHTQLQPYNEIQNIKDNTLRDQIKSSYEKSIAEYEQAAKELVKKYSIERLLSKSLDGMAAAFKTKWAKFNVIASTHRNRKIKIKKEFEEYLDKVKEGIKLEQKYGKLEFDSNGLCKHNGRWLEEAATKHRITQERHDIITAIPSMPPIKHKSNLSAT